MLQLWFGLGLAERLIFLILQFLASQGGTACFRSNLPAVLAPLRQLLFRCHCQEFDARRNLSPSGLSMDVVALLDVA